jgi:PAS domain-containing protein
VPVEATAKILPDRRSLAFVRDITERKRAERERDEALHRMRAVVEQSPVGLILALGPQGGALELNAPAQQIIGRPRTVDELRGMVSKLDGKPPDPAELPIARVVK